MIKTKPIHYAIISTALVYLSSMSGSFVITHALLLGASILSLLSVIKGITSYDEGDHHCLAGIGAIFCLLGGISSTGGLVVIGVVFYGVYAVASPRQKFA